MVEPIALTVTTAISVMITATVTATAMVATALKMTLLGHEYISIKDNTG